MAIGYALNSVLLQQAGLEIAAPVSVQQIQPHEFGMTLHISRHVIPLRRGDESRQRLDLLAHAGPSSVGRH